MATLDSPTPTGIKIVRLIAAGKADDYLDSVIDTCVKRRQTVAVLEAVQINIGDRVRLKSIRPKYLAGRTGVLRGWVGSKMVVELDNPPIGPGGRRRFAQTQNLPPSCVEKA